MTLEESATDRAAPADTAAGTSSRASVTIGFSTEMNRAEVQRGFLMSPAMKGRFSWRGTNITFTPSSRLDPSGRYAVAVIGAHDLQGNPLGGDVSFSFNTTYPKTIILNNYPHFLQHFERPNKYFMDLAATDILRTQELNVPHYTPNSHVRKISVAAKSMKYPSNRSKCYRKHR